MLQKLINKTRFPIVYSVEHELKKIAILRIFLGLIVLIRYLEIFYTISIFSPGMLAVQSILLFVIIVLFIFGIFTPVATLALIICVNWFDSLAATGTLGTNILTQLLIVMFLVNHGLYGSVDSWLMQSKNFFSNSIKSIYKILGKPSKDSIRTAYFFGFLFYAFTSLGAIILHIEDSYWLQGLTLQSALTNSYLFKFYESMRQFESLFPNILYMMSALGVIIQSIFQFLMIPLIFFSLGRKFVVLWGLIFFIISLVGINLSYLPHVEIIFWLMIFFTIKPKSEVSIIYDDHCNLCTKGMLFFKAINYNGRYSFIALSKNRELYEAEGLSEKEVRTYMVGWKDKKQYIGYELYIIMAKANPLLWIFLPILYLGRFQNIGAKVYSYIAERRYKFLGVCSVSSEDIIKKELSLDFLMSKRLVLQSLYFGLGIVLLLFVLFSAPTGIKESMDRTSSRSLLIAFSKFGLMVPNVFNYTDLSMGNHWLVMHRVNDGQLELVPITGLDGKRLNYENFDFLNFSNHNSDFFYFGNTLRYRRHMIKVEEDELKVFHSKGHGYKSISKRIQFDYKRSSLSGLIKYKIDVYKNHSSVVEKWSIDKKRHKANKIYSSLFTFDGKNLTEVEE